MQTVRSLDKKWKEFLFAFSGFGPNLLMILFGAYFQNAVNPIALDADNSIFAIAPSVIFIYPALFPILFAIGRVFDGIIDIPSRISRIRFQPNGGVAVPRSPYVCFR